MAVMIPESLVLRGIGVANGVRTELKTIGSNPGQEPRAVPSMQRSTSPRSPQADYPLVMRSDTGALRAGRSGSCGHVSVSPSPAPAAPRTPPKGCCSAATARHTEDWRRGSTAAKAPATVGRLQRRQDPALDAAPAAHETGMAHQGPLTGASTALLRGKGAR